MWKLLNRIWRRIRQPPWVPMHLSLVALSLYVGQISVMAQRYVEVSARIEALSYKMPDLATGNNPIRRSFVVVCTTGTNDWRIDISDAGGGQHWQFDGTNLYNNVLVAKRDRDLVGSQPDTLPRGDTRTPAATNSPEIASTVHIWASADGCPLDDRKVNMPWLAFCSGSYLRVPGRVVPLPIVDLRHAPDGFAYSDKTETFQDDLGLPRSLDLFASDALFVASVTTGPFEGKRDVSLWRRGSTGFKWDLPDNSLRFRYLVTESTNYLGWALPIRCEWFLNATETGRLIPLGSATVSSIRACSRPDGVIQPELNPAIVDWRFAAIAKGVKGLIYYSSNSTALPTNDAGLQRQFSARIRDAARSDGSRHAARGVCLALLGALLIPLAYLFYYQARRTSVK